MDKYYFKSPEDAVYVVNQLLEKRDWSRLANYYYESHQALKNDVVKVQVAIEILDEPLPGQQ